LPELSILVSIALRQLFIVSGGCGHPIALDYVFQLPSGKLSSCQLELEGSMKMDFQCSIASGNSLHVQRNYNKVQIIPCVSIALRQLSSCQQWAIYLNTTSSVPIALRQLSHVSFREPTSKVVDLRFNCPQATLSCQLFDVSEEREVEISFNCPQATLSCQQEG